MIPGDTWTEPGTLQLDEKSERGIGSLQQANITIVSHSNCKYLETKGQQEICHIARLTELLK
uniref:Uncharacterized protein n=1 Tax=Magallana gigas TaxID=29159 RepID=K1RX32_MAGGI